MGEPRTVAGQSTAEAPKLGHAWLCYGCAAKIGLRSTFMMISSARPCEGCGDVIGYEGVREPREVIDGASGELKTVNMWRPTNLVAPYMEMWRNKMWPVAFGIAVQDFGGAHVHEWETSMWAREMPDGRKDYRREHCRCGEKKERWT